VNGTWSVVGTAGFSKGSVGDINLAIDSTGIAFVSYTDNGNVIGQKTVVRKVQCAPGHYGNGTNCTACAAGTSSAGYGSSNSSSCTVCASGSYAASGASSCTPCAAGSYTVSPGATFCLPTRTSKSSGGMSDDEIGRAASLSAFGFVCICVGFIYFWRRRTQRKRQELAQKACEQETKSTI
jgi:hypothetical protein